MAKRKRLTPAQADYLAPTEARAVSPRAGIPAPIAQVASDASAAAALAEVTQALTAARAEGRLLLRLDPDSIDPAYLVRDRIETEPEAMAALVESLRNHGQRMPVEVTETGPGRYGLISGWRRWQALCQLRHEGAENVTVLALLRPRTEAGSAYIAMVEENEVRLGLSYYERARIAAKAVDLGVFETEKAALLQLFASASRARRSKIRSFLAIYRALDDVLRFPAALPERLGLTLASLIDTSPDRLAALRENLGQTPATTAAEEQARLTRLCAKKALTKPETRSEVAPGISLVTRKGRIELTGPGVGPDLAKRLERWLQGQ